MKLKPQTAVLYKEAGAYVRQLRLKAELSQLNLSQQLGIEYYTFISSVETGKNKVPLERVFEWARALNVEPRDFARNLLRFYEPHMFAALFERHRQ